MIMAGKEGHHKARLAHGWIVCVSKTYPNKLYYFNVHTGDACWECPNLVSPADSTSTNKELTESKLMKKSKHSYLDTDKSVIANSDKSKHKVPILEKTFKSATCSTDSQGNNCIDKKNTPCDNKSATTETSHSTSIKNPVRLRFKLKRPNSLKSIKEQLCKKETPSKCSPHVQQSENSKTVVILNKTKLKTQNSEQLKGKESKEIEKKTLSEENVQSMGKRILLARKAIKFSEKEKQSSVIKMHPLEKPLPIKSAKRLLLQEKTSSEKRPRIEKSSLEKCLGEKSPHLEKLLVAEKKIKSPKKANHAVEKMVPAQNENQPLTRIQQTIQNKSRKLIHFEKELCSDILQSSECTSTVTSAVDEMISLKTKPIPSKKDYIVEKRPSYVTKPQEDSSASDAEMLDVSAELTCSLNTYEPMQTEDSCDVDKGFWIVVDTNILISELKFVDELKDLPLEGCGPPTIYIPWVVMQELDCLKDNKNKKVSEINSSRAGVAVRHLYVWLTAQHPRIRGQTSSEAEKQRKNLHSQCNDDEILECCLQLASQVTKDRLILLTNDKNLCNKALINDIRAHTRESLLQHIKVDFSDKSYNITGNEGTISVPHTNTMTTVEMRKEVDKIICSMKMKLKQLLEPIVESGMKNAFGEDWSSLVIIPPPWSLLDILYCLKKHWIAVFGSIFTRKAKGYVESLLNELKLSKGYIYDEEQASKLLNSAVSLCAHIPKTCANSVLQKMQELKLACDLLCRNTKQRNTSQLNNVETVDDPYENHRKVLAVFQHIWDLINHLCGVVLDSLNCHHDFNYTRPDILPSSKEILDFMPKFYPQLQQLKRTMLSIVLPEPDMCYKKTVSQLFHLLHTFVPNLEIQAEEPPIAGISEDTFLEFCTSINNKDLLQNGYQQLIQFYDQIHKCVHGVL